jgi:exodeoxyribonuclease X
MEQMLFPGADEPALTLPRLIFLDTETTGTEAGTDKICQVCFIEGETVRTEFFRPAFPIPVKAMSIHHITNKMVEGKPAFERSSFARDLQKTLQDSILVAHNAPFDIAMLAAEGVKTNRFICTYRVAFALDTEDRIPEYNLQYLRYHFGLEIEAAAHDAEGDVKVLRGVFEVLLRQLSREKGSDAAAIETMVQISAQPMIFRKINFGKYRDHRLADLVVSDRAYLEWLLAQKQKSGDDSDWVYSLQHYLKK